jgi:hypothetical protein
MPLQSIRVLLLGSLGCSLFFSNTVAFAQVVVPTVPSGSSTTIPTSTTVDDSSTRFSCQSNNGQFTVMYQPQSQYRPDGLQELQIARENRENIICVTTEAQPSCRIVLTVPRGKDPYTIRNSVFQNLTTADTGQQTIAVNTYNNRNSGNDNSLYSLGRTLLGGSKNQVTSAKGGINLKPYLDPKDGGTGGKLRNGIAIQVNTTLQSPSRLNPGRFR